MGKVHYVYSNRATRYLEQYHRRVGEAFKQYQGVWTKVLFTDLIRHGKIKKDRVIPLSRAITDAQRQVFEYVEEIIRFEQIKRNASKKFTPVHSCLVHFSPASVFAPGSSTTDKGLVFQSFASCFSGDQITLYQDRMGIEINQHALGRLEEREIERDAPFKGIIRNAREITLLAGMYQLFFRFYGMTRIAIPYGDHMLLGFVNEYRIPEGEPFRLATVVTKAGPRNREVGAKGLQTVLTISTAVEFNALWEQQDWLRDQLHAYYVINQKALETLFGITHMVVNAEESMVRTLVEGLWEVFQPIAQSEAWKRQTKETI